MAKTEQAVESATLGEIRRMLEVGATRLFLLPEVMRRIEATEIAPVPSEGAAQDLAGRCREIRDVWIPQLAEKIEQHESWTGQPVGLDASLARLTPVEERLTRARRDAYEIELATLEAACQNWEHARGTRFHVKLPKLKLQEFPGNKLQPVLARALDGELQSRWPGR